MQKEGLIRHLGPSEVGVEEVEAAGRHFAVATVQNEYNVVNRKSEAVLDHCTKAGIGFIPWFPLAAGSLAQPDSVLSGIAKKLGATPSQVALAWVLKRSPVMLPIPGTSKPDHLVENVAAAALTLSGADVEVLDREARKIGDPHPRPLSTKLPSLPVSFLFWNNEIHLILSRPRDAVVSKDESGPTYRSSFDRAAARLAQDEDD